MQFAVLKLGSAVEDFFRPARWAVGAVAVEREAGRIAGERFGVDRADRAQEVDLLAAALFSGEFGVGGGGEVAEERGDLAFVEVEPGDQRVEVADERVDRAQQRREVVAEQLAQRREAGRRLLLDGGQRFEELLRFRRQFAELDQGRRQFFGDRDQLLGERIGVGGEALQAIDRQARLVEEGREGAEQRFDVLVAIRGRLEQFVRAADQVRQLPFAAAQRFERLRAVAEQFRDRQLPGC